MLNGPKCETVGLKLVDQSQCQVKETFHKPCDAILARVRLLFVKLEWSPPQKRNGKQPKNNGRWPPKKMRENFLKKL